MLIILVTLFNKRVTNSPSIQCLLKCRHLLTNSKLIIWDNSPESLHSFDIEKLTKALPLIYIHTPDNLNLSKIYNETSGKFVSKNDFLLILDDDSKFKVDLIENILHNITDQREINLFLPIVMVENKIISPAYNYVISNSSIKKKLFGVLKSKYLTAINSGMVISGRVFEDGFTYDTRLKFYGTDNYFMYRFRKKYDKVLILNSNIEHDLSFNSSPINKKARIFHETKKSNHIIFNDSKLNLMLAIINNVIVSFIYSIKFKSFKFFR